MTKKLIEVTLPLEAINNAYVDEKFIRIVHPANLHQWWSRKPLVAARAVLFAFLYKQYRHDEVPYGVAETLSKAKKISTQGFIEAGILDARSGKVRLLWREELKARWNPKTDPQITAWEVVQYLVQRLDKEGEQSAAALLKQLANSGEKCQGFSLPPIQLL